jgi:hypothetical protein
MRFVSSMLFSLVTAGFVAVATSPVAAQKADFSPGLEVGKKAPEFVLNDQDGKKQQLSKMLKNGPVALVFHRSAQW